MTRRSTGSAVRAHHSAVQGPRRPAGICSATDASPHPALVAEDLTATAAAKRAGERVASRPAAATRPGVAEHSDEAVVVRAADDGGPHGVADDRALVDPQPRNVRTT